MVLLWDWYSQPRERHLNNQKKGFIFGEGSKKKLGQELNIPVCPFVLPWKVSFFPGTKLVSKLSGVQTGELPLKFV